MGGYFILFFLVFNYFNNKIEIVLMNGHMLYIPEKLCQEYFSGVKFFKHKFKFRWFIVRQDIKIRKSGFTLICPFCNTV